MKAFEEYTPIQRWGNGFTQWKKRYPNGGSAVACVHTSGCTRNLVRSAFEAYELGLDYGLSFNKRIATHMGLKY